MKITLLKFTALSLILLVILTSCKDKKNYDVTGTIIGSYLHREMGTYSYLVQVNKRFQIGQTFEYDRYSECVILLPQYRTYQNVIQVQPYLPLPNWPESFLGLTSLSKFESIINKKIFFSYREYEDDDFALFIVSNPSIGPGSCASPDVPKYIITGCKIFNY